MQETKEMWVQSLGQEDPLKEGMATNTSILAWKIQWTEELGKLLSIPRSVDPSLHLQSQQQYTESFSYQVTPAILP